MGMLVLTRYVNEEVIITVPDGPQIRVMVVDVRENGNGHKNVRLGFTAPPEVIVDRKEIDDQKHKQVAHEAVNAVE